MKCKHEWKECGQSVRKGKDADGDWREVTRYYRCKAAKCKAKKNETDARVYAKE